MKKYIAEMLGTMVLVLMGCGTAVSLSCTSSDPNLASTVIGTALAFGLSVVAMAYTVGGISGCHINPAITLGCLLSGRMNGNHSSQHFSNVLFHNSLIKLICYIMFKKVISLKCFCKCINKKI